MFYSSVSYTGFGALISIAIIAAGVPFYLLLNRQEKKTHSFYSSFLMSLIISSLFSVLEVKILTTIVTIKAMKKAGIISYRFC